MCPFLRVGNEIEAGVVLCVEPDAARIDAAPLQHRDEGVAEFVLPDPRDVAAGAAEARGREHEVGRVSAPAAAKAGDLAQSAGRLRGHFHHRLANGDQIGQRRAPPLTLVSTATATTLPSTP